MNKQRIQQLVDALPEDTELDVFIDKLNLLRKIEIGEQQLARGEAIPHEDVVRQLDEWLK